MSEAIPVTVLPPTIINTVSPCSPLAAAAVVEEVRGSLTSRRRAISSQAPIVRILGDRILTRRRGQTFWRVASAGEKIGPVGVSYFLGGSFFQMFASRTKLPNVTSFSFRPILYCSIAQSL